MSEDHSRLRAQVEAWIADDPDEGAREELRALLADAEQEGELADRFRAELEFGTAGLRGVMAAGPNRMNRAVIIRATAGLVAHLLEVEPEGASRGVVVGFDGRHRSAEFAEDVAAVLAAAGVRAHVFSEPVPTPLVAFGVLDTGAAAGICVTASHNPPEYNGYKVFWGNGAQIVPPHDAGISAQIDAVASICAVPRMDPGEARTKSLRVDIDATLGERYLAGVEGLLLGEARDHDLVVAYSAMHGVGERWVREAFARAGFANFHSVTAQATPDGDFPTVNFPNPEEPGALDLVEGLAKEVAADLVVANDPDADRLAVMVPSDAGWRALGGNEIGALLMHYLLEVGPQDEKRFIVSSIVSSPIIYEIAKVHGARTQQTLTGHKWIQNAAMAVEGEGYRTVFAYEEALGYGVGSLVRDKDGVSAALVFGELASWCKRRGVSVLEELARAYAKYGVWSSRQVSKVYPGAGGSEKIAAALQRVRQAAPAQLGGVDVLVFEDVLVGERKELSTGAVSSSAFPKQNLVIFELAGGHRAMLRPSGTEPKAKCYLDVREELREPTLEGLRAAEERARALLDAIADDFLAAAFG